VSEQEEEGEKEDASISA